MNQKNNAKAVIWRHHIASWEASGLTQAEYCRQNDITLAAFCYWKRRLQEPAENRFVKVDRACEPAQYEIVIPGGIRIVFRNDSSAAALSRLIEALCR